jgi:hypothetical protein
MKALQEMGRKLLDALLESIRSPDRGHNGYMGGKPQNYRNHFSSRDLALDFYRKFVVDLILLAHYILLLLNNRLE